MEILILVLTIVASLVWGMIVISWLDKEKKIASIAYYPIVLGCGYTIVGMLTLGATLISKSLTAGIYITLILSLLPVIYICKSKKRSELLPKIEKNTTGAIHILALWGILIISLFIALHWNTEYLPKAALKGWGDTALHLGMAQHLAAIESFALTHSVLAGEPLTYSFFVNFLSASFIKVGFDISTAWHIPSIILALGFAGMLYAFGIYFLKKKYLAGIFMWIVILGAGLGFLWFGNDLYHSFIQDGVKGFAQTLTNPLFEYTQLDNKTGGRPMGMDSDANISWIVPLISFFSHQRSFLPGAFIALLCMLGLIVYRKDGSFWKWLSLIGLLPIIHIHSFITLSIIGFISIVEVLRKSFKSETFISLSKGVGGALLLGIPQLLFLTENFSKVGGGFMRPSFGWLMCSHAKSWLICDPASGDTNPLWYWTKNFGFIFIGWVIALIYFSIKKNKEVQYPLFLGMTIFIVSNLFVFQPWEFDNNKIIFYWWILAILGALSLWAFTPLKKIWGMILLIIFICGSLTSGIVDFYTHSKKIWAKERENITYGYYDQTHQPIIDWIKNNTLPTDAFLTSSSASQFIPITTGRAIYMGFEGWLWSQGNFPIAQERKRNIQNFLSNGETSPLCQKDIHYFLYDQDFVSEFNAFIQPKILNSLEKVFTNPLNTPQEIYKLPCK